MPTFRGRPSVNAWATFFLALLTSLQIVPRDTPILVPACSWDSPSRSTRRMASSSAGSIVTVFAVGVFCGMNSWVLTGFGIITGFGNLPLRPRRYRFPHDIFVLCCICNVTLIYFCALSNNCNLCINTKKR